jgi:putative endopeptidase
MCLGALVLDGTIPKLEAGMRTRFVCVIFFLLTAAFSSAQEKTTPGMPREIPAFDVNAIDKSADPCVDFYQYSCGTWMKNNPVPPDKSRWGRFDELADHNLYILRDILTEAQAPGKHSAPQTMVGTYYGSCMDESTIEKKGTTPLKIQLSPIDAVKTKKDLIREIAAMHRESTPALFAFIPSPTCTIRLKPWPTSTRAESRCPIATTT